MRYTPDWLAFATRAPDAAKLAMSFALGAFAWVNRDWIQLSPWAAALALLVIAVDPGDIIRGWLFIPLIAYALLTFALHPALRFAAFNRIGDYSYGLYLYAFPIQQALIHMRPDSALWTLFAEASVLTLAVAICSWHTIEKPALDLKTAFSRRRPALS